LFVEPPHLLSVVLLRLAVSTAEAEENDKEDRARPTIGPQVEKTRTGFDGVCVRDSVSSDHGLPHSIHSTNERTSQTPSAKLNPSPRERAIALPRIDSVEDPRFGVLQVESVDGHGDESVFETVGSEIATDCVIREASYTPTATRLTPRFAFFMRKNA
jgi:hypothetical protein